MRFLGFIGPSYTLRSVNVDCQRCINLYPELNETGTGKEQEIAALVPTPGLKLLLDLALGPIRGLYRASNGRLFAVSLDKLFEISSDFTAIERGTLSSLTGHVSMADSGNYLAIVDGTADGFFLKFSDNVWSDIPFPTDINFKTFEGCQKVVCLDGYFIFIQKNTSQFFISGKAGSIVANETTIDAADFAVSEGSPDSINGMITNHRDLWMFNADTIEIFYNSGNAQFPFEPTPGAFIETGLAAPTSVAKIQRSIFWLGKDNGGAGTVYMASGYQPERISTHAVEFAIRGYQDITDAVGYAYQDLGHNFYVLNFPSANTTWVYDTSTRLWHERVYLNQGVLERHRSNYHAYAFEKHLVGDYANGKIYELSNTVYSDAGVEIIRRRVAPHITQGLARVFYSKFQLDIEGGVGLDGIQQGTDPQVMLRFSDDGGHTWSNEKWTSLGKIGQTRRRAIWRRLGQSRDRVFELTVSDPVKVIFIGAEMDIERGGN